MSYLCISVCRLYKVHIAFKNNRQPDLLAHRRVVDSIPIFDLTGRGAEVKSGNGHFCSNFRFEGQVPGIAPNHVTDESVFAQIPSPNVLGPLSPNASSTCAK